MLTRLLIRSRTESHSRRRGRNVPREARYSKDIFSPGRIQRAAVRFRRRRRPCLLREIAATSEDRRGPTTDRRAGRRSMAERFVKAIASASEVLQKVARIDPEARGSRVKRIRL